MQIRAKDAAAVKVALDELGATQTTPMREWEWGWCHILHPDKRSRSYRSHRVKLEKNKYVSQLCEAAEKCTWVEVGDKKEDGTRTRIKFDVPGGSRSPSYWQAPTRTAAPVRPEPQQFHTGFPGETARRATHQRAWERQFPQLQPRPQEEESNGMVGSVKRMEQMMDKFEKLMSQGQPPAPAVATPEVPKRDPLAHDVPK